MGILSSLFRPPVVFIPGTYKLIALRHYINLKGVSVRRLIGLITDYGHKDPYVGVVKAVIKSINPDAEIIDITHSITRHNVLEAAIVLDVSADYFPVGTIFVVVVDPGVGSSRRALLLETTRYILIGPDNGCLSLLAERDGVRRAFDISNSKYRLPEVSYTFHGRDVFAPIAAWVSRGVPLEDVGVEVVWQELNKIAIRRPRVNARERAVTGEILYIDVFGNVMTNIRRGEIELLGAKFGSKLELSVGYENKKYVCTYEATFSRVPIGELACYLNSWGYLEVAVNMGNAADHLKVNINEPIEIKALRDSS